MNHPLTMVVEGLVRLNAVEEDRVTVTERRPRPGRLDIDIDPGVTENVGPIIGYKGENIERVRDLVRALALERALYVRIKVLADAYAHARA